MIAAVAKELHDGHADQHIAVEDEYGPIVWQACCSGRAPSCRWSWRSDKGTAHVELGSLRQTRPDA
jgi:uncharacterized protein (DUF779 family)